MSRVIVLTALACVFVGGLVAAPFMLESSGMCHLQWMRDQKDPAYVHYRCSGDCPDEDPCDLWLSPLGELDCVCGEGQDRYNPTGLDCNAIGIIIQGNFLFHCETVDCDTSCVIPSLPTTAWEDYCDCT